MRKPNIDRRDLVFIMGLLLSAAGWYLAYPPAAFIVPGALLIWLSLWGRG